MTVELIWSKFLEEINMEVNSVVYTTWFKNTQLYKLENNPPVKNQRFLPAPFTQGGLLSARFLLSILVLCDMIKEKAVWI